MTSTLRCHGCGVINESSFTTRTPCDQCGSYWEFPDARSVSLSAPVDRSAGILGFGDALPFTGDTKRSLGEGHTPLIAVDPVKVGLPAQMRLFVKNEAINPTGSFKDRFAVVNTAAAWHAQAPGIICASTGNAGLAAATYANLYELPAVVYLPHQTPSVFVDAIRAMGADVRFCRWTESIEAILSFVKEGWFPATGLTAYPAATPFGVEGYKTIAYEIMRDLADYPPDVISLPVGGGDLLYGVIKGLRELRSDKREWAEPRILASQAESAATLVNAMESSLEEVHPVEHPTSLAISINESCTGRHALDALRSVGGMAVAVSDEEILHATRALTRAGILAEPSSAVTVAATIRAVNSGLIDETASVVCVITAGLVKWTPILSEIALMRGMA